MVVLRCFCYIQYFFSWCTVPHNSIVSYLISIFATTVVELGFSGGEEEDYDEEDDEFLYSYSR